RHRPSAARRSIAPARPLQRAPWLDIPGFNSPEVYGIILCVLALSSRELQNAEVAELADARDSKSRGVAPRVGSTPTFGTRAKKAPFARAPFLFTTCVSLPATSFAWQRRAPLGLARPPKPFFLFAADHSLTDAGRGTKDQPHVTHERLRPAY